MHSNNTQVLRTSAKREARDGGKEKIKQLSAVHCSFCSAHLRPPIKATAVMSKEPIRKHDPLSREASADKFQLNETKCKELRITFSHSRKNFDPIKVNGQDLECVEQAKILGLQISCDLTWNNHVSEVVKKVNKRLYFLRQLKRA